MDGWWRVVPPLTILLALMAAGIINEVRDHRGSTSRDPNTPSSHDAAPAVPPEDASSPVIYYPSDRSLQLPRRNSGRRRPRPTQGRPAQERPSRVSTPVGNGAFGTLRENPHIPLF